MSGSIDLFIKTKIPEDIILQLLNQHIHQGVESIAWPNDASSFFLQYLEYAEGFSLNAGLAWGLDDFELDEISLARTLARELSTEVLFQLQKLELPGGMEWCLARPEGKIYAVNIIELNDGIDIHPDSLVKLIPLDHIGK